MVNKARRRHRHRLVGDRCPNADYLRKRRCGVGRGLPTVELLDTANRSPAHDGAGIDVAGLCA